MKRLRLLTAVAAALVCASVVTAGGALAVGEPVQHGVSFTKGCASPTKIGEPYSCSFTIRNILDQAHDTLTINSLVDVVHSAGGDVSSGDIFNTLKFSVGTFLAGFSTPPTCNGSGSGTVGDPWTGATLCTLPFGSRLNVASTSHYTVQAADFTLTDHKLKDDASLGWNDLCDDPAGTLNSNC